MPKKGKKVSSKLDDKVLENLIELQKVNADLAVKFDSLSRQISNLLNLFEMAAKSFMEKPQVKEGETDKEFLDKIDKLLEQNKVLAKGLTLLEERMREKVYGSQPHASHVPHAPHRAMRREISEEPAAAGSRPLPKF